ncbi:MAG: hypothetical protein V4463_07500 [Pseudomonadota bacterium]
MNLARKIGVLSLKEDVHAQSIAHLAQQDGHHIVRFGTDVLDTSPSSIELADGLVRPGVITDLDGNRHRADQFDVLWWRRPYGPQASAAMADASGIAALVNSSAKLHIDGLFSCCGKVRFVNDRQAAMAAENKIAQMHIAAAVGMAMPRTLFSNDPEPVRHFCRDHPGGTIVKSHANSSTLQIKTSLLSESVLDDDGAIAAAPAIYQQYIEGDRHFRVFVVGTLYQAIQIRNGAVDSRIDLSVPMTPYRFNAVDEARMFAFMKMAKLDMGVFDFKMNDEGRLYFLEVNQQGQFAFMDVIAGTSCLSMTLSYLLNG